MKHSWNEQADGTAKCKRCPAVRSTTTKVTRVRQVLDTDEDGCLVRIVEREHGPAVQVAGAHPHKCGRPLK